MFQCQDGCSGWRIKRGGGRGGYDIDDVGCVSNGGEEGLGGREGYDIDDVQYSVSVMVERKDKEEEREGYDIDDVLCVSNVGEEGQGG